MSNSLFNACLWTKVIPNMCLLCIPGSSSQKQIMEQGQEAARQVAPRGTQQRRWQHTTMWRSSLALQLSRPAFPCSEDVGGLASHSQQMLIQYCWSVCWWQWEVGVILSTPTPVVKQTLEPEGPLS